MGCGGGVGKAKANARLPALLGARNSRQRAVSCRRRIFSFSRLLASYCDCRYASKRISLGGVHTKGREQEAQSKQQASTRREGNKIAGQDRTGPSSSTGLSRYIQ